MIAPCSRMHVWEDRRTSAARSFWELKSVEGLNGKLFCWVWYSDLVFRTGEWIIGQNNPTRIIRHGAKHIGFKISEAFYGVLFSASLPDLILIDLLWGRWDLRALRWCFVYHRRKRWQREGNIRKVWIKGQPSTKESNSLCGLLLRIFTPLQRLFVGEEQWTCDHSNNSDNKGHQTDKFIAQIEWDVFSLGPRTDTQDSQKPSEES